VTLWIIEPRDTLVIRDARPVLEGSPPMRSLDFPWPSSVAGMVRTRVGLDASGHFTLSRQEALGIPVSGPLLASLETGELLAPAPRDCVWFRQGPDRDGRQRLRLAPAPLADGEQTDLGASHGELEHLALPADSPAEKPAQGPAFWRWRELESWLLTPSDRLDDPQLTFGLPALTHEQRIHVAIDPETWTADDGKLFESDGLRFVHGRERLGLAVRCDDARLEEGVVPLGGERRPSFLRRSSTTMPAPPAGLLEKLEATRDARVILLTPALFGAGSRPDGGAGAAPAFGPGVSVTAAAVDRPEIISGWDMAAGGPKPVRRAAPSGSVYWVRFDDGLDVSTWLGAIWLSCVSSAQQDRRDGFGLAVVGVA